MVSEPVKEILTDRGYKSLYRMLERKNRKLEKALKKQKAYAKKGIIEPGVAPKKKEKTTEDDLNSFINKEIIEIPKYGRFEINFYIIGKGKIEARVSKYGTNEIMSSGIAKCHKSDEYNSAIGMEIAITKAILELYKKIY